jgi:asparagine synthase (glutamine-hydrolysing)
MVGTAALAGGPAGVVGALRAGGSRRVFALRMLAAAYLPKPLTRLYWRWSASPYTAADVVAATVDVTPPVPDFVIGSAMRRELVLEAFVTSLPALLRYADRSSMAHSREVRLPFLDRRVAEFAFSLPPAFLCANGVTKRILRDAVRGLVPDPVLARCDKVGFEPPQARWLSAPAWRERIASVLLDGSTRARGTYDSDAIEADLRAGRWRDHRAVWRAFCAETWRAAFSAPLPPTVTVP